MAEYDKGRSRACRVTVMAAEAEDMPVCWICLDGPSIDRPLMHPCRCPSFVHSTCIARWQLQSAGTRREKFCDFCNCELPDWKSVLTPTLGTTAPAVMNVNFDNKTYSFHVAPGADGYRQFTEAIRRAFHLPDDSELNITFTCDEPSSAGSLLTLSGPGAYDAAVHCASVSAARRSTSSPSDRGSSTGQQPALPPLPLRQQQQQEDAAAASGDAASEDSQQPPTTPRLAADHQQQQHQQQAALPSRLSSTSSSSNSLGAAAGAATAGAGTDDPSATTRQQQQQQQAGGSDATHSLPAPLLSHGRTLSGASSASSSGDNTPLPSPSSSTATGAGRRLRRLSRGRQSSESQSSSGLGSSLRSLSRSRSAGSSSSSSAHSRNSSSNSLSEPDAASAPGCFPAGVLSSSNNLVAEAERGSMSSGSSSASGGSSASRRGAGLGRKLRDALAELLISK